MIMKGMPVMSPYPPDAATPNDVRHTRTKDFHVLF